MKVTPSNQTLILANDGPASDKSLKPVNPASTSATGPVLQRVTVVTALPDSTVVYVHADYASPDAARVVATQPYSVPEESPEASDAPSLVRLSAPQYSSLLRSTEGARDVAGNPYTQNAHAERYAQTQRQGAPRSALIDVHA